VSIDTSRPGARSESPLGAAPTAAGRNDRITPRPHPWGVVTWAIGLILVAQLVYILFTTPNFQWDVVGQWFLAGSVIKGLLTTLLLTVVCMAVGIVVGIVVAVLRLSRNRLLKAIAVAYISFFRAIPVLVQLLFWYNLAALFPTLSVGLPFGGPAFFSVHTNDVITPFTAAILGMGLSEAAFMAEIVRGGILSVPPGQTEASIALGLSRPRTFFRVVLPQAMRFIIPPTGNQVINMVKGTSLVSTIAMSELLYSVEAVYQRTFETIPLLIVACLWYLIVTAVLFAGQTWIEAHFAQRRPSFSFRAFVGFLPIHPRATRPRVPEPPTGGDV